MSAHPNELQRLLAEAPFVRALAHQLLADEPDDVVQQTFLKALQDHPADLARPRSWLARVVRNLVTDQRRRLTRRKARERAAAVADRVPSAAELVGIEESHRALVDAVNRLPSQLRTVVLLRYYEDLPPRRIAAALHLPVAVVWEQLRTALHQLRSRLDAEHDSDRRAWLLPLVPVALQPRALPWRELLQPAVVPTLSTGVLVMTTKAKLVATLAAVLMLAGAWAVLPGGATGSGLPDTPAAAAPLVAQGDPPRPGGAAGEVQIASPPREAALLGPEDGRGNGALEVVVRYADGSAGRSVGVCVTETSKQPSHHHRGRTDELGRIVFAAVPAGRVVVTLDRAMVGDMGLASVNRNETASLQLIVTTRLCLSGTVLGLNNEPVARADVVVINEKLWDEESVVVTQTDSAGRFEVKTAFSACWVGARAKDHGASSLQRVNEVPGATEPTGVTIKLPPGGGLKGMVSRIDGTPVADAIVRVGRGGVDVIMGIGDLAQPVPARSRSDAMGLYVINGVPLGAQPVLVRATGFAPWAGSCLMEAGKTCNLQVTLVPESRVVGRVQSSEGKAIPGVIVSSGDRESLFFVRAATDGDGRFTLCPLAPGPVNIAAAKPSLGSASADVQLRSGEEKEVVLVLSRGGGVSGRVLVDDGTPLASARVELLIDERMFTTLTGANGDFDLMKLEPGSGTMVIRHPDMNELRQQVSVPAEVTLTATRKRPGRGSIHGRVLAGDGTAVPAATVELQCVTSPVNSEQLNTDISGRFGFANLYEGEYRIRVRKGGFPALQLPDRQLEDGGTWAVGDLVLVRGGTIQVHPRRPLDSGIQVSVFYKDFRFAAYIQTGVSNLISDQLLPEECHVFITGKDVASEYHEVVVVAGQETVVEAQCDKGRRRTIVVDLPTGGAAPGKWVSSRVRREGRLVALGNGAWKAGHCTLEHCLAPGVYEVELKSGAGGNKVTLTVRDQAEDEPVRIIW